MGLFDVFKKQKNEVLEPIVVDNDAIVAMVDGELIDVTTLSDSMFAEKMMGDSIAFRYEGNSVTVCSPANGELTALFPTGHAFGITRADGVQILVHIGIDTVNSKGEGFTLLNKKQGDQVKAGDPIVKVNLKELSRSYDMATMLIITVTNGKEIHFKGPQTIKRGQSVIE